MKIDLTLPENKILVSDCMTVSEFVREVVERTGNNSINASTVHYHLKNTDNVDYVEVDNVCLIIRNNKSKTFAPGSYYKGRKRTSKMEL